MDPSKDLDTETSLATLKLDLLSEATGSVHEQYDTVLLGYLCVSLVDKSRFGFCWSLYQGDSGSIGYVFVMQCL